MWSFARYTQKFCLRNLQLKNFSNKVQVSSLLFCSPNVRNISNWQCKRFTQSDAKDLTSGVPSVKSDADQLQPKPTYNVSFTCTVCNTRSNHNFSKQAYHNGTVLVQCPKCKNRHLMADHLKIFSEERVTIEDILAKKGETFKKGYGQVINGNVVEFKPPQFKIRPAKSSSSNPSK
ncbi:TIM23 translocase complex subunit Tim15 [Schizosaccharomyces pombe]